jgi:hypothetical protein
LAKVDIVGKAAGRRVSPEALMKFLLLNAFMTKDLRLPIYEL